MYLSFFIIVLELEELPSIVRAISAKESALNMSPSRGKIRPGKELVILDGCNPQQLPEGDDDDGLMEDFQLTLNTTTTRKLSEMSMMERQAEWLRKKQEKVDAERQRLVDEKQKEYTFQPKLIRRSTYSGPKPTDSSTTATTANGTTNGKPITRADSAGSKGGVAQRRKKFLPSSKQAMEVGSNLLDAMKSELKASSNMSLNQNNIENLEVEEDSPREESSASIDPEVVLETYPLVPEQNEPVVAPPPRWSDQPIIGGRKTEFDSSETRVRIILQDAVNFDLSSMYRKTDKKAGRDGIALHVGRHEDTHKEEVIAILFDKEKITEAEAIKWWADHEHRFSEYMRAH
jgi:hypothetical protein